LGALGTSLAIAAFLILFFDPTALYSASFQLSFAAVIAIGAIATRMLRRQTASSRRHVDWLHWLANWLVTSLAVSAAAMIGTAPLVLYHFNYLPLIGPLANILVGPPLCTWALLFGLAAVTALPFSPAAAEIFFGIGTWGLQVADYLTAGLAGLDFTIWLPTPPLPTIFLYYAGVGLLLLGMQRKWARAAGVTALCLCLAVWLGYRIARDHRGRTAVTVLDVGQGAAAVIEFDDGPTILVDGGGYQSDRFNVGERIIAPFLWHRQISRLDDIVVSHPHADHFNGLPFIVSAFAPRRLWINGAPTADPDYKALLRLAAQHDVQIVTAKENGSIYSGKRGQATIIAAGPRSGDDALPGKEEDTNHQSLMVRIRCNEVSFLLPGDIDRRREEELLAEGVDLQADVLVAPHHGDREASQRDFLAAVAPAYLVVSAAERNGFGSPPQRQEGAAALIPLLSTGAEGAVLLETDGQRLLVNTARRKGSPGPFFDQTPNSSRQSR